jgi:ribosomal subunit interface protein
METTMSNHGVFNGCDTGVKAGLKDYWEKKLPRLRRVLVPYRTELQDIRLTVHCHRKNGAAAWYDVRAVVHLPTGALAAEATDDDGYAALDRAADKLVKEIKKHKEQVRRDYVFKRRRGHREDLSAAGGVLQEHAKFRRRDDFFHPTAAGS